MKEVFYILLIGVMSPFVVYFAVKFGTYAYFAGKRRFREDYNGKNETTEEGKTSKAIGKTES